MKNSFKIIMLIIFAGLFSQAYAVGDYVWEEKFTKTLPRAEQGNAKAQYAIGEMLEKGKGTVKNNKKAFNWYNKAAKQGNKKAAYKVGRAYLDGKGVSRNYKNAHRWFKKSANKKYARAEYYLGTLYENGKGVLKDYGEALKWYKRALTGGYGSASEGIKRVAPSQKASGQRQRPVVATFVKPVQKKQILKKSVRAVSKSTKAKVMAGGWKKRNKSVEYLPSSLTRCAAKNGKVECLSSKIFRNIGMADINYTTKAILSGFKSNGAFNVSYRNNVSNIKVTDQEFAISGSKLPVTLGWQGSDHKLACKLENERSMICTKNKSQKFTLRR